MPNPKAVFNCQIRHKDGSLVPVGSTIGGISSTAQVGEVNVYTLNESLFGLKEWLAKLKPLKIQSLSAILVQDSETTIQEIPLHTDDELQDVLISLKQMIYEGSLASKAVYSLLYTIIRVLHTADLNSLSFEFVHGFLVTNEKLESLKCDTDDFNDILRVQPETINIQKQMEASPAAISGAAAYLTFLMHQVANRITSCEQSIRWAEPICHVCQLVLSESDRPHISAALIELCLGILQTQLESVPVNLLAWQRRFWSEIAFCLLELRNVIVWCSDLHDTSNKSDNRHPMSTIREPSSIPSSSASSSHYFNFTELRPSISSKPSNSPATSLLSPSSIKNPRRFVSRATTQHGIARKHRQKALSNAMQPWLSLQQRKRDRNMSSHGFRQAIQTPLRSWAVDANQGYRTTELCPRGPALVTWELLHTLGRGPLLRAVATELNVLFAIDTIIVALVETIFQNAMFDLETNDMQGWWMLCIDLLHDYIDAPLPQCEHQNFDADHNGTQRDVLSLRSRILRIITSLFVDETSAAVSNLNCTVAQKLIDSGISWQRILQGSLTNQWNTPSESVLDALQPYQWLGLEIRRNTSPYVPVNDDLPRLDHAIPVKFSSTEQNEVAARVELLFRQFVVTRTGQEWLCTSLVSNFSGAYQSLRESKLYRKNGGQLLPHQVQECPYQSDPALQSTMCVCHLHDFREKNSHQSILADDCFTRCVVTRSDELNAAISRKDNSVIHIISEAELKDRSKEIPAVLLLLHWQQTNMDWLSDLFPGNELLKLFDLSDRSTASEHNELTGRDSFSIGYALKRLLQYTPNILAWVALNGKYTVGTMGDKLVLKRPQDDVSSPSRYAMLRRSTSIGSTPIVTDTDEECASEPNLWHIPIQWTPDAHYRRQRCILFGQILWSMSQCLSQYPWGDVQVHRAGVWPGAYAEVIQGISASIGFGSKQIFAYWSNLSCIDGTFRISVDDCIAPSKYSSAAGDVSPPDAVDGISDMHSINNACHSLALRLSPASAISLTANVVALALQTQYKDASIPGICAATQLLFHPQTCYLVLRSELSHRLLSRLVKQVDEQIASYFAKPSNDHKVLNDLDRIGSNLTNTAASKPPISAQSTHDNPSSTTGIDSILDKARVLLVPHAFLCHARSWQALIDVQCTNNVQVSSTNTDTHHEHGSPNGVGGTTDVLMTKSFVETIMICCGAIIFSTSEYRKSREYIDVLCKPGISHPKRDLNQQTKELRQSLQTNSCLVLLLRYVVSHLMFLMDQLYRMKMVTESASSPYPANAKSNVSKLLHDELLRYHHVLFQVILVLLRFPDSVVVMYSVMLCRLLLLLIPDSAREFDMLPIFDLLLGWLFAVEEYRWPDVFDVKKINSTHTDSLMTKLINQTKFTRECFTAPCNMPWMVLSAMDDSKVSIANDSELRQSTRQFRPHPFVNFSSGVSSQSELAKKHKSEQTDSIENSNPKGRAVRRLKPIRSPTTLSQKTSTKSSSPSQDDESHRNNRVFASTFTVEEFSRGLIGCLHLLLQNHSLQKSLNTPDNDCLNSELDTAQGSSSSKPFCDTSESSWQRYPRVTGLMFILSASFSSVSFLQHSKSTAFRVEKILILNAMWSSLLSDTGSQRQHEISSKPLFDAFVTCKMPCLLYSICIADEIGSSLRTLALRTLFVMWHLEEAMNDIDTSKIPAASRSNRVRKQVESYFGFGAMEELCLAMLENKVLDLRSMSEHHSSQQTVSTSYASQQRFQYVYVDTKHSHASAILAILSAASSSTQRMLELDTAARLKRIIKTSQQVDVITNCLLAVLNFSMCYDALPKICGALAPLLLIFAKSPLLRYCQQIAIRCWKNMTNHKANRSRLYQLELSFKSDEFFSDIAENLTVQNKNFTDSGRSFVDLEYSLQKKNQFTSYSKGFKSSNTKNASGKSNDAGDVVTAKLTDQKNLQQANDARGSALFSLRRSVQKQEKFVPVENSMNVTTSIRSVQPTLESNTSSKISVAYCKTNQSKQRFLKTVPELNSRLSIPLVESCRLSDQIGSEADESTGWPNFYVAEGEFAPSTLCLRFSLENLSSSEPKYTKTLRCPGDSVPTWKNLYECQTPSSACSAWQNANQALTDVFALWLNRPVFGYVSENMSVFLARSTEKSRYMPLQSTKISFKSQVRRSTMTSFVTKEQSVRNDDNYDDFFESEEAILQGAVTTMEQILERESITANENVEESLRHESHDVVPCSNMQITNSQAQSKSNTSLFKTQRSTGNLGESSTSSAFWSPGAVVGLLKNGSSNAKNISQPSHTQSPSTNSFLKNDVIKRCKSEKSVNKVLFSHVKRSANNAKRSVREILNSPVRAGPVVAHTHKIRVGASSRAKVFQVSMRDYSMKQSNDADSESNNSSKQETPIHSSDHYSASLSMFPHYDGARVCTSMYPHYTLPDGTVVHVYHRRKAHRAVLMSKQLAPPLPTHLHMIALPCLPPPPPPLTLDLSTTVQEGVMISVEHNDTNANIISSIKDFGDFRNEIHKIPWQHVFQTESKNGHSFWVSHSALVGLSLTKPTLSGRTRLSHPDSGDSSPSPKTRSRSRSRSRSGSVSRAMSRTNISIKTRCDDISKLRVSSPLNASIAELQARGCFEQLQEVARETASVAASAICIPLIVSFETLTSSVQNSLDSLDLSMFELRLSKSESKGYCTHPNVIDAALERDWERIIAKPDLPKGIVKLLKDSQLGESLKEILREKYLELWDLFNYYTSMNAMDAFTISTSGYKQFCHDVGLYSVLSKTLTRQAIDQIFITVNKEEDSQAVEQQLNPDHSLMRFEFVEAIIRIACLRYGGSKIVSNSAEAVSMFLDNEIAELCKASNIVQIMTFLSDDYRREYVYANDINATLKAHKTNLDAMHRVFARPQTLQLNGSGARKIEYQTQAVFSWQDPHMSIDGWMSLLGTAQILGQDFTRRDAILCFLGARMRFSDDTDTTLYTRSQHLNFADFCEALVRVAHIKAIPTDEELSVFGGSIQAYCADKGTKNTDISRSVETMYDPSQKEPLPVLLSKLLSIISFNLDKFVGTNDGKLDLADFRRIHQLITHGTKLL